MCGIQGIVSTGSQQQIEHRLASMGNAQRHRGPDDVKHAIYEMPTMVVGFGFQRLSIVDLKLGMQPIENRDSGCTVICNGEIYNAPELKREFEGKAFHTRGDIEILLHLYDRHGIALLEKLNGMFAGAILDRRRQVLYLFRDRFGIKPLYYRSTGTAFEFASEIRPLLATRDSPTTLNRTLLPAFLTYRYIPGENSAFEGIKRLPPGGYLRLDLQTGEREIKYYWSYPTRCEPVSQTTPQLREEFLHHFENAVKVHLRADVDVGCFLSSGIDSAAVTASALELNPGTRLFSAAFREGEYNEIGDIQNFLKEKTGEHTPANHHVTLCDRDSLWSLPKIVESLEDLVALGAIMPTYQLAQETSSQVKAVLTGEGADELFGGYRKFLLEVAAERLPHLSPADRRKLCNDLPELDHYVGIRGESLSDRYTQIETFFPPEELVQLLGADSPPTIIPPDALESISDYPLNVESLLAVECCFRLSCCNLIRADKLTMAHSLEARTPFLDHDLADFATSLPIDFKIDLESRQSKTLCRDAFQQGGILNHYSASRPKQPFTAPVANWLAEPEKLPGFLQEIILGNRIAEQGQLDPGFVRQLAQQVTARDVGPFTLVSAADKLWAICVFSIWQDIFLQGRPVSSFS
jgi:asparagine synthase (glutamine-hydrolysing)